MRRRVSECVCVLRRVFQRVTHSVSSGSHEGLVVPFRAAEFVAPVVLCAGGQIAPGVSRETSGYAEDCASSPWVRRDGFCSC